MAYASLYLPERVGPTLRLGPTLAGLAAAVIGPSLLASVVLAFIFRNEPAQTVFAGTVFFAAFGLMSILTLFLPAMLWRLPFTHAPLRLALFTGTIAGPGPLGYWLIIGGWWNIGALAFPMGAAGGLIFWLVAVRGPPSVQGSSE